MNYHEAIDILKRHFGNKQRIISRHMDTLLNVEAVTSQHNLKGLRHLYKSHVRSRLIWSTSVQLNKLPSEIRLIASLTKIVGVWIPWWRKRYELKSVRW